MKRFQRNKRIYIFLVWLVLAVLGSKAQPNLAFYPLEEQFNASSYNPAFLYPKEKFTFSVFPFGGTSIGYNNQQIIKSLVKQTLSGISSDDDYKKVLQSLTDRSAFTQDLESTLLTFTARLKPGNFNFRIKEIQNFSTSLKGQITRFIFNNDIQSAVVGQIQNLPAQAMHYREYSLGYSLPFRNHKFSAGIRAKIYFGKAAIVSGLSGSIHNISNDYILQAGGKINLSIPLVQTPQNGESSTTLSLSGSNAMEYLMNSGNKGFGADLGIKYNITPKLGFSLSVIDLGRIDWKKNLNSKVFDGEYPIFIGNISSDISANGTEILTKNFRNSSFADSIPNIFNQTYDTTTFTTSLPVNIYAGIKYRINPKITISLVDRYMLLKNLNYNSFAMMASFELNKQLSVSTGYTTISNSYTNVSLALLFQGDWGQMFLGTENLLAFIIPSHSDFAGVSFGTCFYLFKNKNLSKSLSDDYPFFRQKSTRRNQHSGLIVKEYSE